MKVTILTENRNCDNNCINEDGLSIYIEINDNKLLLDSGITDAFLKNAETLGVNLDEVIDYFNEQLSGITEVKKLFAGAKFEIV